MSERITFKNIDETNLEEALLLTVKEEQQKHIETVYDCLYDASNCTPDNTWICCGIYLDDIMIGFAMYGTWINRTKEDELEVWIDRFMIDEDYQGKGYGKRAFGQMSCFVYEIYDTDKIYLSVYEDNEIAVKMYKDLGFEFNGEKDAKGELVMVKNR